MKGVLDILAGIIMIGLAIAGMIALSEMAGETTEEGVMEKNHWANHVPASVPEYKLKYIFSKDFDNLNDFFKRVQKDFNDFKKKYEIVKISYRNGINMTQKVFVCYAVIYYKKKK